ncbi:hypothetical protein SANTM175S_07340 [Streptomyces antimycoticus]
MAEFVQGPHGQLADRALPPSASSAPIGTAPACRLMRPTMGDHVVHLAGEPGVFVDSTCSAISSSARRRLRVRSSIRAASSPRVRTRRPSAMGPTEVTHASMSVEVFSRYAVGSKSETGQGMKCAAASSSAEIPSSRWLGRSRATV